MTANGLTDGQAHRRYDLDWLRVIAFALLIFYHVGMFYVTWGWHVKSQYASAASEPLMLIVNPWRLALLFFISGVAIRFATDKMDSGWRFAGSRLKRIGLPIVFGLYLLVMPQAYFELLQSEVIQPDIWNFYPDYLREEQLFPIPTPTWNHLWYLVYLITYILICLPFLKYLRAIGNSRVFSSLFASPLRLLSVVIVPFIAYELWLSPRFPTTHALVDDWANHAHRFTIFLLGYFAAKNASFWRSVDRALLPAAILCGLLVFVRIQDEWVWDGLRSFLSRDITVVVFTTASVLYAWSSIVLLLALSQRYLNQPSPMLTYFTGAVFCYYVLHQTVIVAAGYYLTNLSLGAWPEFLLLTLITIVACLGGYEVLKRIPYLRVLVGIASPK